MRREELGSLAAFLLIAEERSFTRAAAKLGLQLLTRTTRSVTATEAGERLLETVKPALEDIDRKLALLTELRARPAGTVRITTSMHAARAVLWPVVDRITAANPDIEIELNVNPGFVDIVVERFDAGARLGESLEKDMIALPIGPRMRMAAVAAPAYFARMGVPQTPHDLSRHACINLRLPRLGGLYTWEFEKDGRELRIKVEGQLVLNDVDLIVRAAVAGHGIAFTIEDNVTTQLAEGALVRVLEDWCDPFDGYYLYYPTRRQPSPAFRLVLDALRYRR